MTWIVVKFEEENTDEAVPKSWYDSESSTCYWPPTNTVHSNICEYIKNRKKPEKKWKTYPATILGLYDDYQTAQRKAVKAQTTSDLTSENEETMREKKLRRKKPKKQPRYRWDSSSDSHSTDQNSDDNKYPDVACLNSKTTEPDPDKHRWNSATVHPFPSISLSPYKHKEDNASMPKQKAAVSSSISNSETVGILKEILKETIKVNLKVDDLTSMVVDLMKSNVKSVCSTKAIAKLPAIMNLFPVDEMSLKELESWLTVDGNKDLLVQELIRIGGSDLAEVVKKLMYKIFTNKVGMLYSWEGAKKKWAFKTLGIASVIKDIVRNNEKTKQCSETETVNIIKAWLVRSTESYKNEMIAARKNDIENE